MYRWVEHTSELELHLEAESEEALFADAVAAFVEVVADEAGGAPAQREVEVSGADRAELLVALLEELIFVVETEDFVPDRVDELAVGGETLRAVLTGHVGAPSQLVKAVTYHGLEFVETGRGYRAKLVLDV